MMRRILAALAVTLPSLAASPAAFPPVTLPGQILIAGQGTLAASYPGFTPAPVPNLDLEPPVRPGGRSSAAVSPELFHMQRYYQGEGFTPGSTIQDEQSKRQKPLPGISVSMPLQ